MALTEAQEKQLLEGHTAFTAELAKLTPIAAKVPELETQLKAKDAEIAALKTAQSNFSQEALFNGLKTKYPNVPESVLKALPAEVRETEAAKIQGEFSKVNTATVKTGPDAWANIGGIAPTDETERAAREQESKAKYAEAAKSGSVLDMLSVRSADLIGQLRRALPNT